ncbi:Pre-mRNA-processing factor 31 [Penicillium taxi]|uniref:Pre-mRNA-processing factor 31 n=1 Tax=Penicillium taxi TaxID=168475 RepID=UPI0025456725|nr:Pre-mRNA-processing factor 31 [Penicillium taxi]KAJ5893934.1 Pre-mRNA-processing factor 31 [Penicillium taxi]
MSTADDLLRDLESDNDDNDDNAMMAEESDHDQQMEDEDKANTEPNQVNEFERSQQIDQEIVGLHKVIRDLYAIRFPELDELVTDPVKFAQSIAIFKNNPFDKSHSSADNLVGKPLNVILDGSTLLAVSLAAAGTGGVPLSESELERVMESCVKVIELDKERTVLTENLTSRVNSEAPNMAALIGIYTTALFLNNAGGLETLFKMPACNLAAVGAHRQDSLGLANIGIRAKGFLHNSPIIQEAHKDYKKQALRVTANKLSMCIRMDHMKMYTDGSQGRELYEQCIEHLAKLAEPNPNSLGRALKAPLEKTSKKRGGRRARHDKDAYATTELSKQQNRMAFGEDEEPEIAAGSGTIGLGMMGKDKSGKIRKAAIDQRTRAKLSKNNAGFAVEPNNQALNIFSMDHTERLGARPAMDFTKGVELTAPKTEERKLQQSIQSASNKKKRQADQDGYFDYNDTKGKPDSATE